MIAILVALVLISSPSQVNVGEEFNASVIVENVTDLSAFQIDVSYENLELLEIEKGEAIKNWSVFDYRTIAPNKVRVIAAKFRESSIDNGEILNLKFRLKGNAKIYLDGILSDSNGNKIEVEFRTKEIIVPMIPITPTNEHKNYLTFLENYWFALLPLLIVIAAVVWKLRSW